MQGRSPLTLGLLALVLYLPFEDFLLKWLPVSEPVYSLSRLASEACLYGLLATEVLLHLMRGARLPRTRLDLPLALFFLAALLSIACSQAPVLGGLINFRTLVRYVAVFYLVVFLAPSERDTRTILAILVSCALLQGLLAIVQHLQGGPVPFWLPRASELEIAGYRKEFTVLGGGIEPGAVIGTLGHSVALALFLLVSATLGAALFLVREERSGRSTLAFLAWATGCALGVLFSYSRGAVIALFLAWGVLLFLLRDRPGPRAVLRYSVLLFPIALPFAWLASGSRSEAADPAASGAGALGHLSGALGEEALARQEHSRGWILFDVGAAVLEAARPLGFGPDERHAKERLLESARVPLHRLATYRAFEDVYWVALLAYYGFVGVGLLLWTLARLFSLGREAVRRGGSELTRALGATLCALLLVTVLLSFLVRTFEFRAFAFSFWLLAALVVVTRERERAGVQER